MNKNYRQGAEDAAGVAAKGFNDVGNEAKGLSKQLAENNMVQSKINEGLINTVREIAFGFSASGNALNTMSPEGKTLLINALRLIKSVSDSPTEDAGDYYNHFFTILGVQPLLQSQFDPEKLGYLGQKDSEHILYVLLEYKAFFTDEAASNVAEDIIDNVNISHKRREAFEQSVIETVQDVGLKGILCKYDRKADESETQRLKQKLEEAQREAEVYKLQLNEAKRKETEREQESIKRNDVYESSSQKMTKNKKVKTTDGDKSGFGDVVVAIATLGMNRFFCVDEENNKEQPDNHAILFTDDSITVDSDANSITVG
jgi:hypothetical protein